MDRPDGFQLDTLRMRTPLQRNRGSLPLPARLAIAILLAQPTTTKAEDTFDGGTDERIADISILLDSDVTLSIDIDIDTSALTSFLKRFPTDLVLEVPKVLRRANKEFLISQLEAYKLTIPLDTNKFRENKKMAGDVEAVRLVWNRHVREMEKNGKISGKTSQFFQFDDIYSFAAFVSMFIGPTPEGYVPEGIQPSSKAEEKPDAIIDTPPPPRRIQTELYNRPPAPKIDANSIDKLSDQLIFDIGNEKIRAIALFMKNGMSREHKDKWAELIRRDHKVERELDTREELREGTKLYGQLNPFVTRWNNVYKDRPEFHLDTVEQARDVINLFAGKTPERRPHEEIEDEREKEFYESRER